MLSTMNIAAMRVASQSRRSIHHIHALRFPAAVIRYSRQPGRPSSPVTAAQIEPISHGVPAQRSPTGRVRKGGCVPAFGSGTSASVRAAIWGAVIAEATARQASRRGASEPEFVAGGNRCASHHRTGPCRRRRRAHGPLSEGKASDQDGTSVRTCGLVICRRASATGVRPNWCLWNAGVAARDLHGRELDPAGVTVEAVGRSASCPARLMSSP